MNKKCFRHTSVSSVHYLSLCLLSPCRALCLNDHSEQLQYDLQSLWSQNHAVTDTSSSLLYTWSLSRTTHVDYNPVSNQMATPFGSPHWASTKQSQCYKQLYHKARRNVFLCLTKISTIWTYILYIDTHIHYCLPSDSTDCVIMIDETSSCCSVSYQGLCLT